MRGFERREAGIEVSFKVDVRDERMGVWRPRFGRKAFSSEAEALAAIGKKKGTYRLCRMQDGKASEGVSFDVS
jgi:hypothetical protein